MWASAVDSQVWAEQPRKWSVALDRILAALRFTRANWLINGLAPLSSSVVDIAPVSDTTVGAGAGPITAALVDRPTADTHGAGVDLDSLGVLPSTLVALPLPRAVRLRAPM